MGCEHVPLFDMPTRGYTPLSLLVCEVPFLVLLIGALRIDLPRTGSKTPSVGDCSSSRLLWHDEKTTSHVTTNGADPLKRDQHT